MTGDLVVREIPRLSDIASEVWNALVDSCPDATVFQKYEWITSWWKIYNQGKELYLIAVYRDDLLVGLAPMYIESKVLRFIGGDHTDYNILIWRADEQLVVKMLLDHLMECNGLRVVHFAEIPGDCLLAKELKKRRCIKLRKKDPTPCPRMTGTEENIRNALGKKSVKRSCNKLARNGVVTVQHHGTAKDIEPYLPAFFDHHIERWAVTEYPSLFTDSDNKAFYREIVRSGMPVIFTTVKLDETLVASHFGMLSAGYLLWYKPAFDMKLAAYSPGEVLLSGLIQYVRSNKLAGLDFTRGGESFKLRFSSETRFNDTYVYYCSIFYFISDLVNKVIRKIGRYGGKPHHQ